MTEMKANRALAAAVLTAGIAISPAGAQEMNMQDSVGMHDSTGTQSDANSRTQMRSEMPCGDGPRAGMRSGTMGSGMTGSAMMGARMMGSGMMMQAGRGGMDALFGIRVERMLNLTADDVRSYLAFRLEQLKNKRLKVGDTKVEDGAVIADVVTVDNSLVQRLKVDRQTGTIEYQD